MKNELTYEQAMVELETIVTKLENNETSIDALASHLKKAQELMAFCKKRLLVVEKDIEEISKQTK